jgi:hypothetical protein
MSNELERRTGHVPMSRQATNALDYVSDVERIETAVMRSKTRVFDAAIDIVTYLKARQKEEEQRNPDVAEFIASIVNRRCLGVKYDVEQYELDLSRR